MTKSIWVYGLFKSFICKIQVPCFECNSSVSWRDTFHWKHEIHLLKNRVQSLNSSLQQIRFKNSSFPEQLLNIAILPNICFIKRIIRPSFHYSPQNIYLFQFLFRSSFQVKILYAMYTYSLMSYVMVDFWIRFPL